MVFIALAIIGVLTVIAVLMAIESTMQNGHTSESD